jgi:hypothetical protein
VSYTPLPDNFHARGDLADLTHEAFRLYVCSLTASTYQDWRMEPRDVRAIARAHQITDPAAATLELEEANLWTADGVGWKVHHTGGPHLRPGPGRPPATTPPPNDRAAQKRAERAAGRKPPAEIPAEIEAGIRAETRAEIMAVIPETRPTSQPTSQPLAPNGASAVEPAVTGELIQRNGSLARDLFEHYQQAGHPRAQPSEPNLKVIATRLKQGYSPDRIIAAFYGAQLDPWPGRRQNCSVEDLLRPKNLERFADWFEAGAAPNIDPDDDNPVDRQVRELTGHRPKAIA